ncbi:hypothetical protein [Asanoa iriomotensis]|uniref:hypothetical protein n=1 Tax=Asanoa iriomotensis TaxID=234613 RepID=UPI001941F369|nr:hypothetical protein [Asanoa iriomotensis]
MTAEDPASDNTPQVGLSAPRRHSRRWAGSMTASCRDGVGLLLLAETGELFSHAVELETGP